jgi:CubicO group peptidase (beta-lactamase class C family)
VVNPNARSEVQPGSCGGAALPIGPPDFAGTIITPEVVKSQAGPNSRQDLLEDLGYPDGLIRDAIEGAWHSDKAGASWYVIAGDQLISCGAIGYANASRHSLMYSTTPVPLVSISKTFTAALCLRAEELGLLSLDEPLGPQLGMPESWLGYHATVRRLLGHAEPTARDDVIDCNKLNAVFTESQLDVLKTAFEHEVPPPAAARGGYADGVPCDEMLSLRRYSNAGYNVAAFAAVAAFQRQGSGLNYAELVCREILKPSGITNSDPLVHLNGYSNGRKMAEGWIEADNGELFESGWWEPNACSGSLGLALSVKDLAQVVNSLFCAGKVLSSGSLRSMFQGASDHQPAIEPSVRHGVTCHDAQRSVYGNDGARTGFTSSFRTVPHLEVVVATNSTNPALNAPQLADLLTDMVWFAWHHKGSLRTQSEELLDQINGTWRSGNDNFQLAIGRLGREIVSVNTGRTSRPDLRPIFVPERAPQTKPVGLIMSRLGSTVSGKVYELQPGRLHFGGLTLIMNHILNDEIRTQRLKQLKLRLDVPMEQKRVAVLDLIALAGEQVETVPTTAQLISRELETHCKFWNDLFETDPEFGQRVEVFLNYARQVVSDNACEVRGELSSGSFSRSDATL